MNAVIQEAERLGVALKVENGELAFYGERRSVEEFGRWLRIIEADVTRSLDARRSAARAWSDTLEEIAERWDRRFSGQDDPPWLDENWDLGQQERIADAIRRGDVEASLEMIERWRAAWEWVLEKDATRRNGW